jgi:hypothetical protein
LHGQVAASAVSLVCDAAQAMSRDRGKRPRRRLDMRKRRASFLLAAGVAIGAIIGSTWLGEASTRAFNAAWDTAFGRDEPALVADLQAGSPYGPITETVILPGRSPSDLPRPPSVRSTSGGRRHPCPTNDWVKAAGGASTSSDFVVYVEGRSDRTVRLNGVEVEVLKRRPPIQGFSTSCVLAATLPYRHLEVGLLLRGAAVQLLRPVEVRRRLPGGGTYIDSSRSKMQREPFGFTIRRGEIESFVVSTRMVQCWCAWRLKFLYVIAGNERALTVDDHGEPFETSASTRAQQVSWDQQAQAWRRFTPRRFPGSATSRAGRGDGTG